MSTLTVILIDGPSQAELQGCVPEMTLWGGHFRDILFLSPAESRVGETEAEHLELLQLAGITRWSHYLKL